MSKTIYDIFISYRRDGGGATAGRINDMLTADGYSVSYDVDTLREGRFDIQLLERIEQCQDFILVVDKNCFVRTINPSTDKQEDWLWQELSYALKLKKNIIPVFLAGVEFPPRLPEDIDDVRFCNGPKCVHEYFDSFYTKLKEMLRAYPRLARSINVVTPSPTRSMACLKLKADIDCIFYLDGEERSHLKAGIIHKIPLAKGEYELTFVSEENDKDRQEIEFEMPDVDKVQKVNLSEIRETRLKREAEAKRIAEKELAEKRRKAEEQRLAEERKREAERKAEEERKRREEEERAKEKTFTVGGVSFKMIRVEGGSMGTFYIGETQVTQALWKAVMGNNPSNFKGDDHPVECVSWNDICGNNGTGTDPGCFLYKLNKETGMKFRLPKESEWEYAAKGGHKGRGYEYSGCNSEGELEQYAWYDKNAYYCGSSSSNYGTHAVKTRKPNELDIYDMSGNVWEWCQDLYDPKGSGRVLRGGSWGDGAGNCRVASRLSSSPDYRYGSSGGFRLALVHQ